MTPRPMKISLWCFVGMLLLGCALGCAARPVLFAGDSRSQIRRSLVRHFGIAKSVGEMHTHGRLYEVVDVGIPRRELLVSYYVSDRAEAFGLLIEPEHGVVLGPAGIRSASRTELARTRLPAIRVGQSLPEIRRILTGKAGARAVRGLPIALVRARGGLDLFEEWRTADQSTVLLVDVTVLPFLPSGFFSPDDRPPPLGRPKVCLFQKLGAVVLRSLARRPDNLGEGPDGIKSH